MSNSGIAHDAAEDGIACDIAGLASIATCFLPAAGAPPLFIELRPEALLSTSDFIDWVREHRPLLDALILEHGGIVLRDFPIATAAQFDTFVGLFPVFDGGYVAGMSPRGKVTGNVLESTRLAENLKIILHSEMAYMKRYPPRIAFFCRQAATEGGATTIGSAREFIRRLPAGLMDRLERHQIHIVRNYAARSSSNGASTVASHELVGWNDAFFTDDAAEVEARCRDAGMEALWNGDGSLTLLDIAAPFTQHPVTGERFYRNNLHANRGANGRWGNDEKLQRDARRSSGQFLDTGEPLSAEEAAGIRSILEDIEISWRWRDGDVMLLDNLQMLHGREAFSGPREVLVALLD